MARKKGLSQDFRHTKTKEMARKKKKREEEEVETLGIWRLEEHVTQAILAMLFFVLFAFFSLAGFSLAGVAGERTFALLSNLLGFGYFLLPLSMLFLSIAFWRKIEVVFAISNMLGITLFFVSGLGIINIATGEQGGLLGNFISSPLLLLFDFYVTYLLLTGIMIVSFVMLFDIKLSNLTLDSFRLKRKDEEEDEDDLPLVHPAGGLSAEKAIMEERAREAQERYENEKKGKIGILGIGKKGEKDMDMDGKLMGDASRLGTPFTPPPLNLLEKDSGKPSVGDIKANANLIKRTLRNFGIDVEMDEISIGPTVTRYALKPAEGVKLSRIEGLQKEIQAALSARTIRVEAPIPGRSLVGIEIPNITKSTVGLASLLSSPLFTQSDRALLVTLGKNIAGQPEFADLAKMPHILVAGATGAGKSVAVHMLIASLLYRNPPESLKFILIDPKRVELTLYNDIPHLLTPVIKNAKKAILALKWAAKEMERRYDLLESSKVQNIESYHKNVLAPAIKKIKKRGELKEGDVEDEMPELMPYIVIIIDELADIMSAYPKELEAAVVRLAQMSRAVGIHLILSTQRPDVRIITGLIKANIPSRIALQVASQIDSRTIIDKAGAEKLLGKGDMLYQGGEMGKPSRIQSGFVTEDELKKLTSWLINHYAEKLQDTIDFDSESRENNTESIFSSTIESDSDDDDKYEEARETVLNAGKASTSFLQRKLGVGYSRAAKLVDMLEERGVIGPQNGTKPREVIRSTSDTSNSEHSSHESANLYEPHDNQSGLNKERF
jgi:DNA segregation ATPase FtsK/SpoIIIE, S-DNA-T family